EDTWWESPWGRGRPGWHIECSAMAEAFLGPAFEIHGGGLDLVFPHHENEIAQSRAAGREFARIWMHNGMLRLAGEKMSKSVGNIVSLREALDRWGRETLLVYFLGGHWRKPIDYSDDVLEQAAAQAESFRNVFRSGSESVGEWEPFAAALEDDFNTPEALAVMHGWRDHDLLRRGLAVFGLEALAEAEAAPVELEDLARAEPYRYAEAYELASGPAPLLAVLDSVTDPRNLGAVIRSAEGAGASGVVLPAHNTARVTPAVCRASAGAVEHLPVAVVKNLARYLGEVKSQHLWLWAAEGGAEKTMWQADLSGGVAFVF